MASIITKDMKIHAAKVFKEYIEDTNNSIYITVGKANLWANDAAPPTPVYCTEEINDFWSNMTGGKKLTGNDIYYAASRYTWTSNTRYAEYRSDADMGNNQYYVVTSDWNVYKCISNGFGKISTTEPTAISPTNISNTSDGYIWKYMLTLSTNERQRFMTENVIPLKTLTVDNGSLQWQVQNNAISGAIFNAYIQAPGSNYSNASNIIVTVSGDGSGANATVGINNISNVVNSITFSSYGTGYTYASISISGGGGSGANIIPIISPYNGHGYDPVSELSATSLIINGRIQNSENGIISIENDIRQIGLVEAPKKYGSSNIQSNTAFSQTMDLTMANYGSDYEEDELVYQGTSYATSTFSARVLEWDSPNLILKLINIDGTPTSDVLNGVNTAASRYVVEIDSNPDCEPRTGKVLYMENIVPIERAPYQTESFKITLNF